MGEHDDRDRAVALAGVLESASLVAEAARTGSVHNQDLERAIGTLFTFEAESAADALGGLPALRPALRRLLEQLAKPQDPDATRYGVTLLHHARVLLQRTDLLTRLRTNLHEAASEAADKQPDDAELIARLAQIYSDHVSVIEPRIMVRGDPEKLARTEVADLVRTLLLCGIRAAVLWQQCGGSRWRLLLGRRALIRACETLIAER